MPRLLSAPVLDSLGQAADAAAARTALGVPALSGDAFTGPISAPGTVFGVTKTNSGGAAVNYKLATLEGSSAAGSSSRMVIYGVLDDTWFSNGQTPFQLYIATRGGLQAQMVWYGTARTNAKILVFLETDNTYTVWLRLPPGGYTSAGLIIHAGTSWTAYRDTPAGSSSGTLVYDSSATATYPPVAVLSFASDMRAFLACSNDAAARSELGLGALAIKSTVGYADISASVGGRNLLPNSSFEQGLTGWTPSVVTATVSSTQARVGATSVKLTTAAPNWNVWIRATVSVKPLTTYTATAWLYVESIAGDAYLGRDLMVIDGGDANNWVTGSSLTTSHSVGVWTRKTVRLTTSATSTSVSVYLYCPSGTVYWDCVQVEEGDVPTAWRPHPSEVTDPVLINTPQLINLKAAADDAAAATAGVPVGGMYQAAGVLRVRLS